MDAPSNCPPAGRASGDLLSAISSLPSELSPQPLLRKKNSNLLSRDFHTTWYPSLIPLPKIDKLFKTASQSPFFFSHACPFDLSPSDVKIVLNETYVSYMQCPSRFSRPQSRHWLYVCLVFFHNHFPPNYVVFRNHVPTINSPSALPLNTSIPPSLNFPFQSVGW